MKKQWNSIIPERVYFTYVIWRLLFGILWCPKNLVTYYQAVDHLFLHDSLKMGSMTKEEQKHHRWYRRMQKWVILPNLGRVVVWRRENAWVSRFIIRWQRRWSRITLLFILCDTRRYMKKQGQSIEDAMKEYRYYAKQHATNYTKDMRQARRMERWVIVPWLERWS